MRQLPLQFLRRSAANVFHRSVAAFLDVISTANPDLSAFRDAGVKLLSWLGLADQLIAPEGTIQYYNQVLGLDPNAANFYHLFFAPETYHYQARLAPSPYDSLDALVK